jgi:glycogen operon protein
MEEFSRKGDNPRVLDTRIDFYPTHTYKNFKLRPGKPFPFGATLVPSGVNFSIFSSNGTRCTLVLFQKGADEPMIEIPFPDSFRIGNVWSMIVFDLDCENIEYGYRVDGSFHAVSGHRYDFSKILIDPYAKAIAGREVWGRQPDWNRQPQYRSRLVFEDFDWEDDRHLEIPMEDLVIYEMHVRGFTKHPSSGVRHPGTYAAIRDRISYLKELNINCIELMPIFEFDEFEGSRELRPGHRLYNYWGYSTVGFFAPKAGYAATGPLGMHADELKSLIKELHRNGIEVILDVVFNHTAEGNEHGPYISYKGIDNQTYYMLTPEGYYMNFSGCGNTLNCNNPVVRSMVLDCLRYWVAEYHIDGFRFDLAAILGRDPWGAPLSNPPLLETLAFDPVLGKCKLIAEAWDAGGLYQVGTFPAYGRWAEWNGKYRDDIRRFLKGDAGMAGIAAQRLAGSPDVYKSGGRGPTASINFITCHDGFTLQDLFSYNDKHNEANGEENRDGGNDNHSWNCGEEGETSDPGVLALRKRMVKNAWAVLMLSRGVPMALMGDEFGHTQKGNNNAYCQDNELSWLDWSLREKNTELFRFAKNMIALRLAHTVLRGAEHFRNADYVGSGYPDISWHGTRAWNADFSENSRAISFLLCGKHARGGTTTDDSIYAAFNCHHEALSFELPSLPHGMTWRVAVNTGNAAPEDICEPGAELQLPPDQCDFLVGPRSVIVLVGRT